MENINALEFIRMNKEQKLKALNDQYKKAKNQNELIEIIKYIERVKTSA